MKLFQCSAAKTAILLFLLSSFFTFQSSAQNCQSNNYAANQPVTTSDNPGNAANLVDGNMTTDWFTSRDGGDWIYVDLGQSRSLCKATLKWSVWSGNPPMIIQGSNTANNDWVNLGTIAAASDGTHSSDNTYDYADVDLSSTTTSYRYVRLYFVSGAAYWHIKELEVYVKAAAPVPTVSITSPDDGDNYVAGANITFKSSASEVSGSISKVEYYEGTNLIGQATTAPYSFTWQHVEEGEYTITAKAYDANNASSVSSSIDVYVDLPSDVWALGGNTGNSDTAYVGTRDNRALVFKTNNLERFRVSADGRLGIGTTTQPDSALLAVNGQLWARKLKITQSSWADYVFAENYKLLSLPSLESYIKEHHHLPGMPSTREVTTKGIDVGNNQETLLKKIEELTLYVIELNKKVNKLEKENQQLKKPAHRK